MSSESILNFSYKHLFVPTYSHSIYFLPYLDDL